MSRCTPLGPRTSAADDTDARPAFASGSDAGVIYRASHEASVKTARLARVAGVRSLMGDLAPAQTDAEIKRPAWHAARRAALARAATTVVREAPSPKPLWRSPNYGQTYDPALSFEPARYEIRSAPHVDHATLCPRFLCTEDDRCSDELIELRDPSWSVQGPASGRESKGSHRDASLDNVSLSELVDGLEVGNTAPPDVQDARYRREELKALRDEFSLTVDIDALAPDPDPHYNAAQAAKRAASKTKGKPGRPPRMRALLGVGARHETARAPRKDRSGSIASPSPPASAALGPEVTTLLRAARGFGAALRYTQAMLEDPPESFTIAGPARVLFHRALALPQIADGSAPDAFDAFCSLWTIPTLPTEIER